MRKHPLNHERILEVFRANPDLTGKEIAKLAGCSQASVSTVTRIYGCGVGKAAAALKRAPNHNGGSLPKRRASMSQEQYEWECILHRAGLGIDRGESRLVYLGDYWQVLSLREPLTT